VEFINRPYCETCGCPLDPLAALPDRIPSCDGCPENPWFRKARSVTIYYLDPAAQTVSVVGRAIRLLKYQGKTVMAKPLADLMSKAIPVFFGMEDYDYIVPVPIHKKKRRERGYNQMELIGQRLSSATGIPLETHSFIKVVNTRSQVNLTREERLVEVKDAFDVPDPSRIAGKRILLIDDVLTTGATMNESAKTLMKKGRVKCVDVFTLAR
jgi:ComF family protein